MTTQDAIDALYRITGKVLRPGLDGSLETPEIRQALARFWGIAVPDRIDEQIPQANLTEKLTEDVEYCPAKGGAFFLQLGKQTAVDLSLAGFLGQEVPEVADLRLSDAVYAAEALFDPVWIPGQIVVDH